MLFWYYCMAVEHAETILRIGFAKLLLKKQKTAGGKHNIVLGKRHSVVLESVLQESSATIYVSHY